MLEEVQVPWMQSHFAQLSISRRTTLLCLIRIDCEHLGVQRTDGEELRGFKYYHVHPNVNVYTPSMLLCFPACHESFNANALELRQHHGKTAGNGNCPTSRSARVVGRSCTLFYMAATVRCVNIESIDFLIVLLSSASAYYKFCIRS